MIKQGAILIYALLISLCTQAAEVTTTAATAALQTHPGQPRPQLVRDPFAPSDYLFELVGNQARQNMLGNYGFIRAQDVKIPHIRLRGFIDNKKGDQHTMLALLEIKGLRTFVVQEGDEISIDPSAPNHVIKIAKITRDSVIVETGRLGAIRIQR